MIGASLESLGSVLFEGRLGTFEGKIIKITLALMMKVIKDIG